MSQLHLWAPRSVDLFAGGGGASEGILRATGRAPLVAINHDEDAIVMHAKNHPGSLHLCDDVLSVKPFLPHGKPIHLLWLSPDCRHFSRAKGSKPLSAKIRALPGTSVTWARAVRPWVIGLENVVEIMSAGPLYPEDHPNPKLRNRPIPERAGEHWRQWISDLRSEGYQVEWRVLNAADYGAPTARKRLFLIARCDGRPIVWPEPTHGPGRQHPYRTAGECIDWSRPMLSVFATRAEAKRFATEVGVHPPRRPLAAKTMARVAEGVRRFVLEADDPFVAPNAGPSWLISTRNGERKGQTPRVRDLRDPFPTVTAKGSQGALVTAFVAKHNGGVIGHDVHRPLGAVTARDSHAVVLAHLTKYYGTGAVGQSLGTPMHTVPTKDRFGLVTSHLIKFYGTSTGSSLAAPMPTVTAGGNHLGLVTTYLYGEPYVLVDVAMRMLQPRELARAQGFPEEYILTGTKEQRTARIGNAVPPQVVEAVVRAQFGLDVHGQPQPLRMVA